MISALLVPSSFIDPGQTISDVRSWYFTLVRCDASIRSLLGGCVARLFRRRREYAGPVVFSYGFRPFFLGGALWAALSVLLWLPQYFGELSLPTAFAPLDWHIHEMLYGYVAAIVTG